MLLMSILFIMNIQKINETSYAYPERLREINSPPNPLYVFGNLNLLADTKRPWIAIIGTRYPSVYGQDMTYQLAMELSASGAVIVSGLALGVDAIAHQAAIDQGMPTVAVLARGLDAMYPVENEQLGNQIPKDGGTIVSEYKPGIGAYKQHFVARNRLISALSDIILVTEATKDSGTRHTVRFAQEQNKSVMAVPGNINSPQSAGTNNMIRQGAKMVTSASDVLLEIGLKSTLIDKPVKADSREEGALLDLLREGVNKSEELIARSGLSAMDFANVMSLMEISGKVANLGAGTWVIRG